MKHIFKAVAILLGGLFVFGCQQKEQDHQARAVAAGETYLEFAATGAAEQVLPIYADGLWAVDVEGDWISVSPLSGDGAGEIVISVSDNVTGGIQNLPREGKITLQGGSRERNAVVTIHQDGDTYFGVQTRTLAQIRELEDGDVAKVAQAQAVALAKEGFIARDDSGFLYVKGEGVALGDKISFNGAKNTVSEAAAFVLDEFTVMESQAAVVYPEATDITATLANFDFSSSQFVTLSASLIGTNIYVNKDVQIPLMGTPDSFELSKLDLHKVTFTGFNVGKSLLLTAVSDNGADEALIPYPLKFKVRVDGINYTTASFAEDSRIDPVNGLGYIEYVPFDLEGTDGNQKYKLDVSDKSPRVTGPWPGDYWLFYGNGAIKAGSDVRIAFEARTSATGHKFWLLEFLDGTEWRPACATLTTNEPGEEVVYSHAMNADGATNVQADYTVRYRKNTDHAQFRFRCMANWQASGAGALAARNGGSARLTVTDTADETYQPTIEILKEGNGVEKDPVYANIEVSTDLLTFNGTPGDPKVITVKSDYDFTISTSSDWLTLDVEGGLAGEDTQISVTCAESELSELRQGTLRIVSEDSEKLINVVQSAAGQQLDPFVSVATGSRFEIAAVQGTKSLSVQSNVEVSAESLADWLSVEAAGTKAMVEKTEYVVTYTANESETERTGQVRFYNEASNQEALVTFVQAGKEPEPIYPDGVYFQDDFEWLAQWSSAAPDDVASNSVGTSKNLFTTPELADALAAFQTRGYSYIWGWQGQDWSDGTPDNGNKQTLYLMKNYLKFGKTSYNSGIVLPVLSTIEGTADVDLTFDWCWCMTGAGKPDVMTLTVEVSGGGTVAATGTSVSGEITSGQSTEGDLTTLEWQHATVRILGATPSTRLIIRPTNADPAVSNSARKQNRWYLDNIKVARPEQPKPAVNDVLWEEWWQGSEANETPSAYSASGDKTTVSFGDAPITYTESGATALKADALVFCDKVANAPDPKMVMNLLIAKNNGNLTVSGIPCKGVKTATLTYRSNSKLEGNHQVTSSVAGVSIGTLEATSVPKLDLATKNTYTITCSVSVPENADTIDLTITNINAGSNIRVDGLELVVTEVW